MTAVNRPFLANRQGVPRSAKSQLGPELHGVESVPEGRIARHMAEDELDELAILGDVFEGSTAAKGHEDQVAAFLARAEAVEPARFHEVTRRHVVLSPRALREARKREISAFSPSDEAAEFEADEATPDARESLRATIEGSEIAAADWSRLLPDEDVEPLAEESEEAFEQRNRTRRLLLFVEAGLTPDELAVFERRLEGLTISQIAKATDRAQGTVAALNSRALRKVRATYGDSEATA